MLFFNIHYFIESKLIVLLKNNIDFNRELCGGIYIILQYLLLDLTEQFHVSS